MVYDTSQSPSFGTCPLQHSPVQVLLVIFSFEITVRLKHDGWRFFFEPADMVPWLAGSPRRPPMDMIPLNGIQYTNIYIYISTKCIYTWFKKRRERCLVLLVGSLNNLEKNVHETLNHIGKHKKNTTGQRTGNVEYEAYNLKVFLRFPSIRVEMPQHTQLSSMLL